MTQARACCYSLALTVFIFVFPLSPLHASTNNDSKNLTEKTTIAQCEEIYCPPTECRAPIRLDGECCAVCIEPDINVGPKHCFYEGLSIPDGEVFHPPSMVQAFEEELERKRSQTNVTVSAKDVSVNPFCTQCECKDGSVQCEDVSSKCPTLTCSSEDAFLTDGSCCLECPTPPPRPVEGCADSDGTIYTEGETWNPHYPGFGKVLCFNCTCINGRTKCQKDPCPVVPFCEPDDPIPEIEVCCLKCLPRPNTQATLPPPSTTEEGSTISTERPDIIPETTTTEGVDISPKIVPCTRNDYIIKIFKHPRLDSMALENTETRQVEVYTWSRTGEGVLMKEVMPMTSIEFRERHDPSEYVPVGRTLQRRVNGLTTRESKREKIRRCMEACSTMVVNMLRPVTVDISCPEES